MKTYFENLTKKNSVFCWLGIGTILLLLIPALGMLISNEIQWQVMDFVVMGAMIFGFSAIFVLLSRRVSSNNRVYLAVLVLFIFIALWTELAVGIFT
jgi:hypothetical protein